MKWKEDLQRALRISKSDRSSTYAQIATIDAMGAPRNRTVVMRQFEPERARVHFVTDRRSSKFSELGLEPIAEICWYFGRTREQFRLSGPVVLLDEKADAQFQRERIKAWNALSDGGKETFFWPTPGKLREKSDLFSGTHDLSVPAASFVACQMRVHEVDWLRLKGRPHQRVRSVLSADGEWQESEICP